MTQEHVLAEEEQMTAAQAKQHEDKHTGIPRKDKIRKIGSKAKKRVEIALKASIVTKLPVSTTKPTGDLVIRSAISFLLSSTAVSSASTAAVAPHLREQIDKNHTKLPGFGGYSNSGST